MTIERDPTERGLRISTLSRELGELLLAALQQEQGGEPDPTQQSVGIFSIVVVARKHPEKGALLGFHLSSVIEETYKPMLPVILKIGAGYLAGEASAMSHGTDDVVMERHDVTP